LAARIFAVADTLDAMTSDRPYRTARSWEEARGEIFAQSGRQFDPRVVEAFGEREPQLRQIQRVVAAACSSSRARTRSGAADAASCPASTRAAASSSLAARVKSCAARSRRAQAVPSVRFTFAKRSGVAPAAATMCRQPPKSV